MQKFMKIFRIVTKTCSLFAREIRLKIIFRSFFLHMCFFFRTFARFYVYKRQATSHRCEI